VIKQFGPAVGALLVLTTMFWAPALFGRQTLFHGDFLIVGLPQFDLLARALHGQASLLWSNEVYGGHPLFAEGQGAFAQPVNLLVAAIVAPLFGAVYGANFLLWWSMLCGGIGVAGLCRSLGASPWAAAFAALAVSFSTAWISQLQNPTIAGTMAWLPWSLWALEAWLKRPGLRSAALFGAACALMLLAGYPQGLHASLLYMVASLAVGLVQPALRRDWLQRWRRLLGSGGAAVLIGLGLCAVQWLPLLELAGLSHRQGGVPMVFDPRKLAAAAPATLYLRGFLLPDLQCAGPWCFTVVGSLFVSVTASLLPFVTVPPRVKGHVAAALLLIAIGAQGPVFEFLYGHDLVPGLHYFRVVFLYIVVGVVGVAVAAAFAIDGVTRWAGQGHRPGGRAAALLAAFAGLWLAGILWVGWRQIPPVAYGTVLGAVAAGAVLARYRRAALIPPVMVLALAVECLVVRVHSLEFAPPSLLDEPASIQAIESQPGWRDFKAYDGTFFQIYALKPPHSEGLQRDVRHAAENLAVMQNLQWDLPSFNGALALPLQRRMLIQPEIDDEIQGRSLVPAGLRLIDLLGIRFIALHKPVSSAEFRPFRHDEGDAGWIMENGAALPRFQLYAHHVGVDTPEQALATLRTLTQPALVIENPATDRQAEMADPPGDDPQADLEVVSASATAYRLKISAQAPVWLFLADANYPGWQAVLDDAEIPIFTAQVLGKAMAIPPGEHDLVIRFEPASFRWGLAISLATAGLLAGGFAWATARGFRRPARPRPGS
jgi:hypothetical protein